MKNGKITGIMLLLIGAALVLSPGGTLYSFCRLMGWCLIIAGAVEIVLGLTGTRSPADTSAGAVSAVAGIVFLSHPGLIVSFLPMVIGIVVAGAGAALLIRVLAAKETGVNATMQIIGGVITLVVGLILIFHPISVVKLMMVILGIVLIYYGILVIGRS